MQRSIVERVRQPQDIPESACIVRALGGADPLRVRMPLIEPISREAGEHVDVEMPHVLVSGGLVVLSDGGALAAVCRTDSDSDLLSQLPHGAAVSGRQAVNVLHVSTRNHEHRAVIARPPFRGDTSESAFRDGDHVGVSVVFVTNSPLEFAERA